MPFTLVVVLAAIAVSLARGGRLGRIADADLGWSWLLFTGLFLQILVDRTAGAGWIGDGLSYLGLLASQVAVLVWVWHNRYRPGMPLVFLGLLCNALVIGANGAMPVSPEAITAIGFDGGVPPPGKHELLTAATRLGFLADILPLPPLRTIISVGDIILAAGLVPLTHHLMTFVPAAERRGGRRGRAADAAASEVAAAGEHAGE